MRLSRGIAALALAAAMVPAGSPARAQAGLGQSGFEAYLPQLEAQARRAGVSAGTIASVFPNLVFSARTVQLDRAQPGGRPGSNPNPPFAPYRARHVSPALIAAGRRHYQANLSRLQEIGRRYGVTPSVLVAIYGHETSYGAVMGNFDLLNSLASLAYEGRRRQLFSDEFVAALKMIDRGVPRSRLRGSWAGATGLPQFLPSVWLRLAVDGDGDGRADIWRSEPDAAASIANYLRNAGWKPGVPWGFAVRVPPGLDRSSLRSTLRVQRCQRVYDRHSRSLTMAEWRRLGVTPYHAPWPRDSERAALIEPDGPGATAYLLTENYRAILDYNCSNFYALSVGLLADAIAR